MWVGSIEKRIERKIEKKNRPSEDNPVLGGEVNEDEYEEAYLSVSTLSYQLLPKL